MKRLLLSSFVIIFFLASKAQQTESFIPLNFNSLSKKVAASDKEIANPKKNSQPKAWIKRGELMSQVFWVDLEQISGGMPPFQLKLFYKEPLKESKAEINSQSFEIMEYERMHYYFQNGGLVMWKRIKSVVDDPLDKAYDAYQKAIDLDKTNKLTETIKTGLLKLNEQYKQLGLNEYYFGNKEIGLNSFEKVIEINNLPVMKGVVDTTMLQYAGIISRELGKRDKSILYYEQLKKIKNDPHTYLLLKEDYLATGDTTKAVSIMEEAFNAFPDSLDVIANLIDLTIKTNRSDEGLKIINRSIEKNPSNGLLYYWNGRLLLKSNDENRIEKALESYNKAIQLNPDLSYAYFDIGFVNFLIGQEYFTKAGSENDAALRETLNKEGTASYQKAIPMFEKAIQLNQDDKNILRESYDTLKRVYYKLQMMDKYNEVNEKLKNL